MSAQPCVFIVDDDEAVRDGLEMVMETVGLACQTFKNAEDFLECYDSAIPGCLVLDMDMPGMNGEELQAELIHRKIRLPIIFLTAFGDIPTSVRTVKAGAVDFLTKPVQTSQLIERIQAELQLSAKLQEQSKSDVEFRRRLTSLTPREMDILPLTILGIPNKVIAQKLGISFRTVELHRTNILRKTGANNFLELAHLCEGIGINFEPKPETS